MFFKDIPGLSQVKKHLVESVQKKRISHAQLFHGEEGSPSLPMAIAYAQYISCTQRSADDSCGTCPSCKQFKSLSYPDLHFSYPVASTPAVGSKPTSKDFLKEWQKLHEQDAFFSLQEWLAHVGIQKKQALINVHESAAILRNMSLKSFSGQFKFQIIYCAERLNSSAANKLLKIIEEPEEGTLLILVTEQRENILQTLLSRCQAVFIGKIATEELTPHLTQRYALDKPTAESIAHFAGGSLIKAKTLLQNREALVQHAQLFADWMRACFGARVEQINTSLEGLIQTDRESQKAFLAFSARIVEERMLANYIDNTANPIFEHVPFNEQKFSQLLQPFNAEKILTLLNEASYDISRNGNAKIILLDLSLKMSNALRMKVA